MFGCRNSEFTTNAKLIRMNYERAAQLQDLGAQTKALIDALRSRNCPEMNPGKESSHVPAAGR